MHKRAEFDRRNPRTYGRQSIAAAEMFRKGEIFPQCDPVRNVRFDNVVNGDYIQE
jgi:hypothetical protein